MTGKWSSRKDGFPPGGAVRLQAFFARVYSRSSCASVEISDLMDAELRKAVAEDMG